MDHDSRGFGWTILVLAALVPISLLLSASVGSIPIDWGAVFETIRTGHPSVDYTIVFELRFPRSASALVVGASLALAGLLMQALLKNPLADPYVLGTSGGAAVFALTTMLLGFTHQSVSAAAAVGAVLSLALVIFLSRDAGGWSSTRLLLTGIVVASGWGALISFLLSISQDGQIQGMLFWLMGDVRNGGPGFVHCLVLFSVLAFSLFSSRDLNLLVAGTFKAESLGVHTLRLRFAILIGAGLLTAVAVTLAGAIGFVGLVVPHMMRLIMGSDHRRLIPACLMMGGSLLVITEMLARTVLGPRQLPVGVITAFVGVPLFLYLLRRGSRQETV
ncbi:MAG TPA: ABC transporter permease [Gammaproteobacteria bacterium]|nr:ABC transporter permease [Gammaproteobacteria bacterium]